MRTSADYSSPHLLINHFPNILLSAKSYHLCRASLSACAIPQLHLWQNAGQFITGGYADVRHLRLYRWRCGCRYVVNHNWPSSADGKLLTDRGIKLRLQVVAGKLVAPAIIHYGFCERKTSMQQKNRYYVARGEELTRP